MYLSIKIHLFFVGKLSLVEEILAHMYIHTYSCKVIKSAINFNLCVTNDKLKRLTRCLS